MTGYFAVLVVLVVDAIISTVDYIFIHIIYSGIYYMAVKKKIQKMY